MSGQIIYGNPNTAQVFKGSANQFVPPNGSQTETFKSVGSAQAPTVNTSVSSGGNTSEVFGSGSNQFVPPNGSQTDEFKSGTPVTPTGNEAEFLGHTETLPNAEEFGSGTPVTPNTNDSETTGKDLFYGGAQPFVFGSGSFPEPSTNDPEIV